MSVAQTQAKKRREMYWAVDTGLSPHTLILNTLGQIAGDADHVRQPDAYQKAGRCSGRRTQVAPCTRLAKHLGPNSRGRTPCLSTRRMPKQAGRRSGRRTQVRPRTSLAHDLGPNFRGRIPCPSRKRRPQEAGRCSGRWTQACPRTSLPERPWAKHLGPNS